VKVAAYTSFTFSYLGRARILAETMKAHNPDWDLIAIITDRPPRDMKFSVEAEPFDKIIWNEELDIPDMVGWLFKHDIVEVCTAVKGAALEKLLRAGYDYVFYIDPDIAIFGSLDPLIDLHSTNASVTLAPHQLAPESSAYGTIDNEIGSLKHGTYNLGYVGVTNDEAGRAFAKWWAARLQHFCYDDVPNGLFTDQRWCDLVPALFDRVVVLRDPGYNVASWNLGSRRVSLDHPGCIRVGEGNLLRFYHFTKMGPLGRKMTERYGWESPVVFELWRWYEARHAVLAPLDVPKGYWYFGAYENNTPIGRAERLLYRSRMDLQRAFPDPFRSTPGSFQEWYNNGNR